MEDKWEKTINYVRVKVVFSSSGFLKEDVKPAEVWPGAKTCHIEGVNGSMWIGRIDLE